MDFKPVELAVGAVGLPTVGFLAKWLWDRVWKKTDGAKEAAEKARVAKEKEREDRVNLLIENVAAVVRRQDVIEAREGERARVLGVLESNQNRLDGKVDGLQKHWTGRFDKLEEEFKGLEDKVTYKLDNFRMELRGDQQSLEERIVKLFGDHQNRMHARLNEATAAQASALMELMDKLVDRVGEPRPSPAKAPT